MAVEVRDSKITGAGSGLFAVCSFDVGDWVVAYGGKKWVFEGPGHIERANARATALQAANSHSVFLGHGDGCCIVVDGSGGKRSEPVGYMINSNPTAANAKYVVRDRNVWVQAIAPIAEGDEIYVDYGFGHAFGHGIVGTGGAPREVVNAIRDHFNGSVNRTRKQVQEVHVLKPKRKKTYVSFV